MAEDLLATTYDSHVQKMRVCFQKLSIDRILITQFGRVKGRG